MAATGSKTTTQKTAAIDGATIAPGAADLGRPVKLARPETTLRDKYVLEQGTIFLSGIQALVRVLLDQHRADTRRGLDTGTFVSGYQGSPLGSLDKELMRLGEIGEQAALHFTPGLNEELAATAVYGSQLALNLAPAHPAKKDGVVGVCCGVVATLVSLPGVGKATLPVWSAGFTHSRRWRTFVRAGPGARP